MSWLKRLFEKPASEAPIVQGPMTTELVPGKLVCRIFTHDFVAMSRTIPCWTYITEGFASLSQKEFVFTLVRAPDEKAAAPPTDPLKLFAQLFSFAQQKHFVDVGGSTCFQPRTGSFLGLTGMAGFVYAAPQQIPGVDMPALDRCLCAILVVPGEAEWINGAGGYRILTRLGRANQYYPHPPWSDRRRAPVFRKEDLASSFLTKMPLSHINGAYLRMPMQPTSVPDAGAWMDAGPLGDCVMLRIGKDRHPRVREVLEKVAANSDGAFSLTFDADPSANARLAWEAGDKAPSVIAANSSNPTMLTGGFVSVIFGDKITDSGRVIEDGFVMTFAPKSWEQFRSALYNAEPIEMPSAPGQVAVSLDWIGP